MELPRTDLCRGNVLYLLDMATFLVIFRRVYKSYIFPTRTSYITISPVTYIQELNMFLLCSLNSWTTNHEKYNLPPDQSQAPEKRIKLVGLSSFQLRKVSFCEVFWYKFCRFRRCIKGAMPLTYWKVYAMFSAWRRWSSELGSYQHWPLLHHQLFSLGIHATQRFFRGGNNYITPSETHVFFSHFYRGDITSLHL